MGRIYILQTPFTYSEIYVTVIVHTIMNATFTRGGDICPWFVVITFQRLMNSAPLSPGRCTISTQFLDTEDGSNYIYQAPAYTTT
jgi:hypothetical protein